MFVDSYILHVFFFSTKKLSRRNFEEVAYYNNVDKPNIRGLACPPLRFIKKQNLSNDLRVLLIMWPGTKIGDKPRILTVTDFPAVKF